MVKFMAELKDARLPGRNFKEIETTMKKLMTMMVGLSLAIGASNLMAQDKTTTEPTKEKAKAKGKAKDAKGKDAKGKAKDAKDTTKDSKDKK